MRPNYAWARRRKPVTFRGVRFEVLVQNREGGHRHQVHQYLGFDDPYTQTFGLGASTYSLEGIVAGANYDKDLDKLVAALRKSGAGRLTLWHGKALRVVCRKWRIVERSDSAGFARLTIDFVDAGRRFQPSLSTDGRSALGKALAKVKATATAAFEAVTSNVAAIESLATSMQELGEGIKGAFEDAMNSIDQAGGLATEMATGLQDFGDNLASYATDAASMGDGVSGMFDELAAVPGEYGRRYKSIASLSSHGDSLPAVSSSTFVGGLEADNQAAFAALIRRLAVSHAADMAMRLEFKGAQDAAELRDELAALLDTAILEAGDAGDDDVFLELRQVKAIAVEHLDRRAARLPTRVDIALERSVPSLVMSQRLYGTADRAIEIAERNSVRHPAFIPAPSMLEVLAVGANA